MRESPLTEFVMDGRQLIAVHCGRELSLSRPGKQNVGVSRSVM